MYLIIKGGGRLDVMKLNKLTPYRSNTAYFDDMQGEDYDDLKKSISEHGIIEPIIVNQRNIIICGHQRYRACQDLRIEEIPVVVREVKDNEEHETLLIEENLRRRQLSTSSMARAIKRLYEIRGIDGAGRPKGDNTATVAELAKETGKSERTVRTLRTIADLIPELSRMLDAKTITQKVAYQLAQMDDEGQNLVFAHLEEQSEGATIHETAAKDFKDKYKALQSELKDAQNKPAEKITVPPVDYAQNKEDLKQSQLRARSLEEALMEAENKPAQIVERTVEVQDDKAIEKLKREKKTYQEKANAMTHELANYERRIKNLEKQIEVDNPTNIDIATAKDIQSCMRMINFDVKMAVSDAIQIGGVLDETKAVLVAMINSLTETFNMIEGQVVIDITKG